MNVRERLKRVEERLKAQGVKDVKFTYGPNAETATKEQIMEDAATMLEAYLDGHTTPAPPFGDSVREL